MAENQDEVDGVRDPILEVKFNISLPKETVKINHLGKKIKNNGLFKRAKRDP